jgi:hypothetical protein
VELVDIWDGEKIGVKLIIIDIFRYAYVNPGVASSHLCSRLLLNPASPAISQIHAKINDKYAIFHFVLSIFNLKDHTKQLLNLLKLF